MLLASLLFFVPTLQAVRVPTAVADGDPAILGGPEVAGAAEHVVAVWRTLSSELLNLSQSDGRGVSWSPPMALDVTPGSANLLRFDLSAAGSLAFLAWDDDRLQPGAPGFQASGATFVRPFDLETQALGAEVGIPLPGPAATTETELHDLIATEVEGAIHVHLLLYARSFVSGARGWLLASSHDGGATFPFVQTVVNDLVFPSDQAALAVDGSTLHVFWEFSGVGLGSEIRHQRSLDGGATLDFAAPQVVGSTPIAGIKMLVADAQAGRAMVGWADTRLASEEPFELSERVFGAMSSDGGASFAAPALLAEVTDPWNRFFVSDAFVDRATGNGVLAFRQTGNDSGTTLVFTARTLDGGASWSAPANFASGGGVSYVGLVGDRSGRERVVALAGFDDPKFPISLEQGFAALSTDGGATFGPPFALISNGTVTGAIYDERYQNVVATLRSLDSTAIQAGGFRPQTLTPLGFNAGPTTLSAQFDRFDDGSAGGCLGWILVSLSAGDLALPDGRCTGLAADPILLSTFQLASAGVLIAQLDALGQGTTNELPGFLPAGLTLYAVGLSIDPQQPGFGELSDVVTIEL